MAAVKVMRTSDNDDDDAKTLRRNNATMPEMPTTMLTRREEEDGRHDCPAAAGGRTILIAGWAVRRMASFGRHRALPPRRQRRPLALEDLLILCHGFMPADRPPLLSIA